MRSRQDIIEQFSSFLQLEGDRFHNWAIDPQLRRSMQTCLNSALDDAPQVQSDRFWALYWHKLWTQSHPQAQAHLSAYAQEPCYWAAHKTVSGFASAQYTLADCFQMAIVQLEKILKGFDNAQGFSFKNYASATFASLIRERLRQRQEIDICTDWSLLRKLSQKRLVESLQNVGLPAHIIDRYLLAWTCFRTCYQPAQAGGTRKLPPPDRSTWEAIVRLYIQESTGNDPPTVVNIERWLLACAEAARAYLYPKTLSINTPKPGQESGEFLDDLPQAAAPSLLAELIAQEEDQHRQDQHQQINAVLTAALDQLDGEAIEILQAYYGNQLTQQQMATQLNLKQYTVSRRLTKARAALLLALAKWAQETLHITATPDLLKNVSLVLEEWLTVFYSHSPATPEAIATQPL